jgi:hypothetical protein
MIFALTANYQLYLIYKQINYWAVYRLGLYFVGWFAGSVLASLFYTTYVSSHPRSTYSVVRQDNSRASQLPSAQEQWHGIILQNSFSTIYSRALATIVLFVLYLFITYVSCSVLSKCEGITHDPFYLRMLMCVADGEEERGVRFNPGIVCSCIAATMTLFILKLRETKAQLQSL